MNAATRDRLRLFANAARVLRHMVPDAVPPVPDIDDTGNPWPSIDEARYWCERLGAWSPGRHAHYAYAHWHRLAWLNVLRAATIAAGHGDDDAPRWDRMSVAELADELADLADTTA